MKNSILNSLLALGLLLISITASANRLTMGPGFKTINTRKAINTGINKIIKINANKVTRNMHGVGFETNYGQRYSLDQVRFINPNSKSALSKLLQRDRVEMVTGEIIYREEIQYGLIQNRPKIFNPLEKAPHTPD